jgi:hypothetical protein
MVYRLDLRFRVQGLEVGEQGFSLRVRFSGFEVYSLEVRV